MSVDFSPQKKKNVENLKKKKIYGKILVFFSGVRISIFTVFWGEKFEILVFLISDDFFAPSVRRARRCKKKLRNPKN